MTLTKEQILNRKKWIAALRSGEYKQGHGYLYNPKHNTYCCLGVACKLFNEPVLGFDGSKRQMASYIKFKELFGLEEPAIICQLAVANDGKYNDTFDENLSSSAFDFDEIADVIENMTYAENDIEDLDQIK